MSKILIPMTEYVIEIDKGTNDEINPILTSWNDVVDYANFLKQPLKLEMFIPCDDDGSFLEQPLFKDYSGVLPDINYKDALKRYKKALSKVIFKGFEAGSHGSKYKNIMFGNKCLTLNIEAGYFENSLDQVFETIEDLTHLNLEIKNQ